MSQQTPHGEMGQALLISSDTATCRLTDKALGAEGYETVVCNDIAEAASIAAGITPAVIFVDADITSGDPLSLCKAVRQLPACDYIPLILVSDDDSEEALRAAYDASGDAKHHRYP